MSRSHFSWLIEWAGARMSTTPALDTQTSMSLEGVHRNLAGLEVDEQVRRLGHVHRHDVEAVRAEALDDRASRARRWRP